MKVKHNGKECDVPQWALEQAYKNGYAKGVKEFAERLKGEMLGKHCVHFNFEITNAIIDNLVKEMVGADK